ncbi:sulfatase-like hydrolase/transferase [Phenylobacterium sp.]|uniref:sulfatase-like hydrolase/transferase n=1 Tax=Phenylobacterium sp. TaxID=1871053 RepID=UPI002FC93574
MNLRLGKSPLNSGLGVESLDANGAVTLPGTAKTQSVSWRQTAYLFGLLIVVPTVTLVILGARFGFMGPRLNLDLPLLYLATVVASRIAGGLGAVLGILGTAFVVAIQLLLGIGLVYIDNVALLGEYVEFARYWPWGLIAFWLATALAALAALYAVLTRINIGQARLLPVVVLLLAVLGVDLLGRTAIGFELIKTNAATSSTVRFAKVAKAWATNPGFVHERHPGQSMAGVLAGQAATPDRILSVSVEALGLSSNKVFNQAIVAPLEERLAGEYSVTVSAHAFKGATLAGELRELCGLRISGTPTRADSEAIRPECLPATLKARGYQTTGLHGNSKYFYNRGELYRAIGFDKSIFYEDLAGAKVCKTRSFSGACDADVFKAALEAMGQGEKGFAHVMTLQTHFPLAAMRAEDHDCSKIGQVQDPNLCIYANQFADVMDELAGSILAAKTKPDVIYIYGDHAPPYVVASDRMFFNRESVPFITLTRRAAAGVAK